MINPETENPIKEDSLKKRYFHKLFANLFGLGISLITYAIIPRELGPKAYGDFSFLTNYFNEVARLFDMGTSTAFYTKLSQRQKDMGLVLFYLYFIFVFSVIILAFVVLTHATSIHTRLWPGQSVEFIYMAAMWGILTWMVQVFNKMTDARGLTVPSEISRVLQKVIGFTLILFLFLTNTLNLTTFFLYNYTISFFLCFAFVWIMAKNGYFSGFELRMPFIKIKAYLKEFYHYCNPLFALTVIATFAGILDTWILQYFAGSVQQGFFGLSYQIGALCFLFTSAMVPLFTREFSIAFGKSNWSDMERLFRRHIPLLYSIAAYFSCFIAIQADKVIYIFGGNKYHEAGYAVMIMAFFPIHQTYGQLSGSVFFATGQTALYRNIGIAFLLIGLPITFFLVAPEKYFGLNAGSSGLAIKMVLLQIIGVNVQLFYNARFLGFAFWKYFLHQIICVGYLALIAFISMSVVDSMRYFNENIILNFLFSGIIYTSAVFITGYNFPLVFGLKKENLQSVMGSLLALRK